MTHRSCPQAVKSLEEEGSVSAPLNYKGEKQKARKWREGRLSFCFDFNILNCFKMGQANVSPFFFFGKFSSFIIKFQRNLISFTSFSNSTWDCFFFHFEGNNVLKWFLLETLL